MRIKEIVLDGFKSYSHRTVVSDFDYQYNAITGLNGSGKSNILDAICFVLGISNLHTVRANHLQELIYKNGQAGITKANVTILFDNSDSERCHPGYQKFREISVRREITLGGHSKYTLNGTKVTRDKIKQIFVGAGLNVNSANFLVMQGRITQVINMKPNEIKNFIEQTVGTHCYEEQKQKSLGLLERKQRKITEIYDILAKELLPKLEKLRTENKQYLDWKTHKEAVEELEKKLVYARYARALEFANCSYDTLEDIKAHMCFLDTKWGECKTRIKETKDVLQSLKASQDSEELNCARAALKLAFESFSESETEFYSKVQAKEEKRNKLAELSTKGQLLTSACRELDLRLGEAQHAQSEAKELFNSKRTQLEALQSKVHAIENGLSVSTDVTKERLLEKTSYLQRLQLEQAQTEQQLQESRVRLEQHKKKLQHYSAQQQHDSSTLEQLRAEIKQLTGRLNNYSPGFDSSLAQQQNKLKSLEIDIQSSDRRLHNMNSARFSLNYQAPEPGFDNRRVKGRVIRLVQLKETKYARAIEAGAGGRMYSVVVDTDVTAGLLLKHKTLGNVSILPNNKMRGQVVSERVKSVVRNLYADKAHLALDLLEYDRTISNSIEFVFGGFFVCDNREIAQNIAYGNEIKRLAVTLEGDVYDPNGVISGGENHREGPSLMKLIEFEKIEKEKEKLAKQAKEAREDLSRIENEAKKRDEDLNQLELLRNQLRNKERLAQDSSYNSVQTELAAAHNDVKRLDEKVQDLDKKATTTDREIQHLKRDSSQSLGAKAQLTQEIHDLERELSAAKEEKELSIKQFSECEQQKDSHTVKFNDTQTMILKYSEMVQAFETELLLRKKLLEGLHAEYADKQRGLAQLEEKIAMDDNNIRDLKEQLNALGAQEKSITGDIQSQKTELKELTGKISAANKEYKELETQHRWVTELEYDLSQYDLPAETANFEEATRKLDQEGRKINKQVSATLVDQERSLLELYDKQKVLEKDRSAIEDALYKLDTKKEQSIEDSWRSMNENLSEIFSDLLPGADAKIVKSSGKVEGFELAVGFNGAWRTSLSELSGGQRSLLALSFILSSLKYHPAPIYILDEIDAALDMSHTQNIGSTLRKYFEKSQFIVVSLKEGMFNNANMLFRTSFHEGRSFIERIPLRGTDEENKKKTHFKVSY